MFKKDSIFWAAAGIFALAIVLFVITKEQLWLALMIVSYLLRPTLASLGVSRTGVDERQMSIQYRSGNIAFAAMMATAVILAAIQSAKGDPNWDLFNIIIFLGLATKALFNVLLVKNYREGAARIIMAAGLMVTLFASMSHGLSLETLLEATPGLAIVGIGYLSRKFPRTMGTLLLVVTAALLVLILKKGFTIGQIVTATLIGVPLAVAGACLFVPDRRESSAQRESAAQTAGAE